jgi:5-methylcytosine-specific restriction enzyme subunit McrC
LDQDRTNERRTLTVTERRAVLCRLAAADVEYLLAEHSTHVTLAPTGRRGRYRLTPAGHVGTILCPTCRLVIRPKIAIQNLFYLLDLAGPLPAVEDLATVAPGAEGLTFLASRLAQLLAERAAAGLHHAYAERTDQGPYLQGRLDLPAHLSDPGGRKDQLHSRFEEFTADVPCNQVPKATAELVLRSPLLGQAVAAALRKSLDAYAAVQSIALGPQSFDAALTDRLTMAYRPLLDLCRLLAEGLEPTKTAGLTLCPAFLLDMDQVFEGYVTRGLAATCVGSESWDFVAQPLLVASQPCSGQPDLQLRPDFTVAWGGRLVLVGDVKWKVLAKTPLLTADVYQVLAYCTALGVHRGVLVYPGRRNWVWVYRLAHAPVTLEIRTVRVTGSREACARSLRLLGRRVLC